jgi:hypothetical protein
MREREREQEKQNEENDYSLRHDCFLSFFFVGVL